MPCHAAIRGRIALVHFRRFACFLLGLWLGGGLFMDMVVTQNFRSVDRLLAKPATAASQQLDKLAPGAGRVLLRYQVSEQNRWYFETWGIIETAIGAVLLLLLLFGSAEKNFSLLLVLLMLLIAIVQRFALTPEMVVLGRIIDWVPIDQPSPERSRFWMLHYAYVSLELLNWALGLALTAKLIFRSRRHRVDEEAVSLEGPSRAAM
ncbi:MAG TPA: hypothetical protein VMR62_31945 [Bryobacteraceae bacterium]|jgi:hypothetical protein|nr:hypothetical protein [Bryobacteraceae bacterium]